MLVYAIPSWYDAWEKNKASILKFNDKVSKITDASVHSTNILPSNVCMAKYLSPVTNIKKAGRSA